VSGTGRVEVQPIAGKAVRLWKTEGRGGRLGKCPQIREWAVDTMSRLHRVRV
jgi:hypothetical protein